MATLAPPNSRLFDSGMSPPDQVDEPRGGGGRGWVELTKTSGDIEAHLLTGRLSESGIESRTLTDRSAPGAFLYGGHDPWAPVSVLVRKLQLVEAHLVLAELAYEAPPADRTTHVPRRGRSGVVWWICAIALALAFTVLGMVQMIERCERTGPCDRIATNG